MFWASENFGRFGIKREKRGWQGKQNEAYSTVNGFLEVGRISDSRIKGARQFENNSREGT